MSQYLIQGIFAVTGLIAFLAGIFNWDWFFTSQNAQFVVGKAGRKKARWIYGCLGLALMIMAVFFYLSTPPSTSA